MNAQGKTLIDTSYIDNLVKQINEIDVCSDLQRIVSEAMASIQAQLDAIEDQVAFIKPILKILTNPGAALQEIVTWISDFIDSVLKPMYQPYLTMVAQVEATVEAIAAIPVAVAQAAERIGECVVELPSIVVSQVS